MGFVLGVLAVLGAVVFWIIRLGAVANASREIGDAVGDLAGAARRARIRKKANAAPLDTLDDPRDAAVALMVAITLTEGTLTESQASYIAKEAEQRLGYEDGQEALAHGRWLCKDALEPGHVIHRVLPLLIKTCDEDQKKDVVRLVSEVAGIGSPPAKIQLQAIEKLKYDLGLRKSY